MTEQTDIVAEFIEELIPKDVVEAAQLLVTLKYPIPDKKSLVLQLEKRKTDNPQNQKADAEFLRPTSELIDDIAGSFKPADFGLDTPQSALEKFFARMSQDCSCESLPDLRPLGLPDLPVGEPPPWLPTTPEEIASSFGLDTCGRAAAQVWVESLTGRFSLGPSPATYRVLKERLDRCRRLGSLRFRGRCGATADYARALCLMRALDSSIASDRECMEQARREYELCRAALPFGGDDAPGGF